VAGLGVGQPRHHGSKTQNAVESILSRPARWSGSWCGFGDKTILQWPAMAVATRSPAAPRCAFGKFPGVTVPHVGADGLGIRESNTAFGYSAHAAPGAFSTSLHNTKWACHEIPNREVSEATAKQVIAVGGRDHA
jgi:hypothetical protein